MMLDLSIRSATPNDTEAMRAILNAEIRDGVNVWHETERGAQEMQDWLAERHAGGFAVLVAQRGAVVVGYAGYGPFRPHSGYRGTVEHSVYVAPEHRGGGAGRALLEALVAEAERAGFRAMIGGVEAGNVPSLALHARLGFQETGRLPDVGQKFGRWLTLVFVQRTFS